jgi:hypothetical protein
MISKNFRPGEWLRCTTDGRAVRFLRYDGADMALCECVYEGPEGFVDELRIYPEAILERG